MNRKTFMLVAMVILMGTGTVACQPDEPEEHLEEAGEELEAAGRDAANEVEDTCEEIKEEAGAEDTDC